MQKVVAATIHNSHFLFYISDDDLYIKTAEEIIEETEMFIEDNGEPYGSPDWRDHVVDELICPVVDHCLVQGYGQWTWEVFCDMSEAIKHANRMDYGLDFNVYVVSFSFRPVVDENELIELTGSIYNSIKKIKTKNIIQKWWARMRHRFF
jgi:hypothetical protein